MDLKRQALDEQNRKANKSTKALEVERREEGLSTAISENNKGFAMMAKLGYKPGQSLGQSTSGIAEPIEIKVRAGRGGLGKRTAEEQLNEYRQRKSVAKETEWTEISDDFRQRVTQKRIQKELESTL